MLITMAVRNLTRNVRRTIAILITVSLGTGSLFIFNGFNVGLMNQYRENTIHARYGHGQVNTKGYRDKVFQKPSEHWISNWPELKINLLKFPGVQQLFPRVTFSGLLTNGKISIGGWGQGIDGPEESVFFNTLNIEMGKNLSTEEDGILLGKGLAAALDAKPGSQITVLGNTINGSMNAVDLNVVGIFHTGSKDFDDTVFRIPLQQAHTLLDTTKVESVAIGLKNVDDWTRFAQRIMAQEGSLDATSFAILDKVYYQNSVDWLNSQFGVIQTIIVSIVVLGIFNTVSTGIMERKQEIGNLRANGESRNDVLKLLICEGLALGIAGAFLGLLLGLVFVNTILRNGILMPPAPGITRQFHILIELQPKMAAVTFVMGAAASTFGAFLSALKVSRMQISEALRAI